MRTEVALLTLLAVTAITLYTLNDAHTIQNKDFELWKAKYGKSYTAREESYRISIWLKNLEFVEAHNARYILGEETYQVEMNGFADLSNEEFGAKYLIKYPSSVTTKCTGNPEQSLEVPESADWTQKGAVTGVKNQGQCGSCWAFSSTGSLEGAYFNAKGSLASFSEQQLVDCSGSYGNQGCNGGLMNLSFFYVKDHGITTEQKYAYHGTKSTCKYNEENDKVWQISDCVEVKEDSEEALRKAIAKNPVSVAIQANQIGFQLYKKGVFSGRCGTKLDHGVLAVGYGVQDGKEYYKVKNSWGAGWGLNGYILILRKENDTGKGECGIQMAASYPVA